MTPEGEKLLVAGYEEISLPSLGQREQITVLWIGRRGTGRKVAAEKREVPNTCGKEFRRARSEVLPEKWPGSNIVEFFHQSVTGHEGELLSLPGIQQFGGRARRRQQR